MGVKLCSGDVAGDAYVVGILAHQLGDSIEQNQFSAASPIPMQTLETSLRGAEDEEDGR